MPSQRRVNWAKFRVMVVSFVALIILITLFYLLTGGTVLQPKATLYVYVPDATGLGKGSPVRVDGIDVGTVRSVELSDSKDPNRVVKVTLDVQRDRLNSMAVDSYAELSSDSLIGDKFVDITSGRAARSIEPGAEVRFRTDLMSRSLDLRQFEQRLRQVDAMLTDIEQGRGRVGQLVQGTEVYTKLVQRIAQIHNDIRVATSRSTAVGQALYTDKLYRQISDPLVQLDRNLAQMQSGQGAIGQLLTDSAQYEQVRASVQAFSKSIADIHAGELFTSDELYTQWTRGLASLVQSVNDFNAGPNFSTSAAYDNLAGSVRELGQSLKDFRTDPRKYLRLKVF